jgi:hypothetical protein
LPAGTASDVKATERSHPPDLAGGRAGERMKTNPTLPIWQSISRSDPHPGAKRSHSGRPAPGTREIEASIIGVVTMV